MASNTSISEKMLSSCPEIHLIASNSFMKVEYQFLKWVLDWENRVFPSIWKGQYQYCFTVTNCRQMNDSVKNYHTNSRDELGQDRLAWSVFAKALLKEHSKLKHNNRCCTFKRYLYLLVWISFYLNLSNCKLVQLVLSDILVCNQNLKFLFTFLPGMCISFYISLFLEKRSSKFEDKLCKEFFSMVNEDNSGSAEHSDIYHWSQSLIYFLVKNLTPLHGSSNAATLGSHFINQRNSNTPTLITLLDKKILPYCKHNLLTLAVQFSDIALIELLLKIGVSAGFRMWDPVKEEMITAERIMINTINSIMMSQQLLSRRQNVSDDALGSVQNLKENITSYAKKLRRSMLLPESRKANNVWDGEKWRMELNKEIADEWGIGCSRPLPSLQHMAKICVRKQILRVDRELLPSAINQLPVPYLLKRYLNLELD